MTGPSQCSRRAGAAATELGPVRVRDRRRNGAERGGILPVPRDRYAAGEPSGPATVVAVRRGAPRGPGAAMAVGPDDEVVGSVSGGAWRARCSSRRGRRWRAGRRGRRPSATATRTPSRPVFPAAAGSPCWCGRSRPSSIRRPGGRRVVAANEPVTAGGRAAPAGRVRRGDGQPS
ncbi:XdhC family protein [Streptomyces sp. NPDC006259]|uniref:XdhC family protein n=1 Tax=Streptomyces sp. NPDC006259 TaxID=3364740 RepID=UPI0036994FAA